MDKEPDLEERLLNTNHIAASTERSLLDKIKYHAAYFLVDGTSNALFSAPIMAVTEYCSGLEKDEIVHHKVMGCVLDNLPREHHEEFLGIFDASPHDEDLLFTYLRKKVGDNIESLIKQEIGGLASELLEEIKD